MFNKKIWCIAILVLSLSSCTTSQLVSDETVSKLYYPNGILKSVWVTKSGMLNGIKREFNENGILQTATNYKNDVISGMHNIYRRDGSLWIKEMNHNGKLVSRREFNEEGLVILEEIFLIDQ